MPTLEQKQDGDYFIRARIPSKDSIITWQVLAAGVTFLSKHGVHAGEKFSHSLLLQMIQSHLVFTGGSGIQSSGTQRELFKKRKSSPSEKIDESAPSVKKISMVFKKYKKRWELLVVFPELPILWIDRNSFNGCRLQLDGAIGSLKASQLLPGKGEASLPVIPQEEVYAVQLIGLWPSHLKKHWLHDIEGLNPSGTLFNKNKGGVRLCPNERILLGNSYYLLAHTKNRPVPLPKKIEMRNLGSQGIWGAWEVNLPRVLDASTLHWCTSIGYSALMY